MISRRPYTLQQTTTMVSWEWLWIRISGGLVAETFICSLYHPPTPIYPVEDILKHLETTTEEISAAFPRALIIIAGDLNTLPEKDIIDATGLTSIVNKPTRGNNM